MTLRIVPNTSCLTTLEFEHADFDVPIPIEALAQLADDPTPETPEALWLFHHWLSDNAALPEAQRHHLLITLDRAEWVTPIYSHPLVTRLYVDRRIREAFAAWQARHPAPVAHGLEFANADCASVIVRLADKGTAK